MKSRKLKIFGTRERAILSSLLLGSIFFIILSPVVSIITSFILPPNPPKNVKVLQKNGEIEIGWDNKSIDIDVIGFKIRVNDEVRDLTADKKSYLIPDLENESSYKISIVSVDNLNRESNPIEFTGVPSLQTSSLQFNLFDEISFNQSSLFGVAILMGALIFLLNNWILFFKLRNASLFTIGLYPTITLIPFTLLIGSIYFSINSEFNQLIFVSATSIGIVILSYILFLTTNILNLSQKLQIPLEQAARASQFIISLISTYTIFIFTLNSNFELFIKFLIILPFIFYFTYSGIWVLKINDRREVLLRSIAITLLMGVVIFIILIWPINTVYAILTSAIIYYILLNVALDYRTKLNLNYWLEYIILVFLIIILLFTSAVWGINGTII